MKKKYFILIILCFLLLLSGCSNNTQTDSPEEKKPTVAATFVPLVAHVRAVVGDLKSIGNSTVSGNSNVSDDVSSSNSNADGFNESENTYQVISIIPPSIDPHEYEPKPEDVKNLEKAEVIFVNDPLFEANVVNLVTDKSKIVDTGINIKKYPLAGSAGLSKNTSTESLTLHEKDLTYDPHFWLAPLNAINQVKVIRDTMIGIDPQNTSTYEKNAEAYIQKLREMDELYFSTFSTIPQKNLVLSHNFYAYPAQRYGLSIVSTLGNLNGVEPTSGQLTDTLTLMKQKGITTVFVENNTENRLIQLISRDFGFRIYPLNSMETSKNAVTANTYLDILEENRVNLEQGLSPSL